MVNANIKSSQFCSVCKQWLDMEVVPTNAGDEDDGVIWFRCPQCQGFLPKLSGADLKFSSASPQEQKSSSPAEGVSDGVKPTENGGDQPMEWDSPADMMASLVDQEAATSVEDSDDDPLLGTADVPLDELESWVGEPDLDLVSAFSPEDDDLLDDEDEKELFPPAKVAEPKAASSSDSVMEYAALLAEKDFSSAMPYRHWETYEVGQCIHHLAWNDCGVVVAKETLPGGRLVIKVYFEEAGVVHLIEQAPR